MKKGLVMEGGAMRGLFTCGVIDVFMENGITFDGAVGISAGAVFGCNYKSHQHGRPRRYNKTFCRDPRYGSFRSWLKSGDLFDVDFCYRVIPEELDPFDAEAFGKDPMEFYIGASDVMSGECVFHLCSDGLERDMLWMRASASMPLVSRIVEVDGYKLLDGGICDSIPYAFMKSKGYDRNVVILTQPRGYRKEKNRLMPLINIALKDYPLICDAMAKRHIIYNRETAQIYEDQKDGLVFVIQPPESLKIGRTEKDPEELERVYQIGRKEAKDHLEELKKFLSEEYAPVQRSERMRKKIRKHFQFYGEVQGVGFRFQAMRAADALGLTGWVKNEYDGSVTMEIQGSAEEIDAALSMISNSRYIHIDRTDERVVPLEDDEHGFNADYW
ncbi:MAG: acylphosphatase [Erysipelotrichaceae bacterium]|nr:acylphosphatase [Erysipelotrichaceae bacterium]